MSMTKEHAEQYKNDPAVLCCRATKGTVIGPAELEDPAIFPDMIDSGLISIGPGTLTVGEVLGATLIRDVDGLTALTGELLEGVKAKAASPVQAVPAPSAAQSAPVQSGGVMRIVAQQITGLDMTIPMGVYAGAPAAECPGEKEWDEELGSLEKREFAVKEVKLGGKTLFENGVLTIREDIVRDALKVSSLVKKLEIDIITPDKRHVRTETVMDVIPVATKIEGDIGSGVTHILDDMVFMLTGVDEDGVQVHEFGSCEGMLDEKVIFGRPGCPDQNDIIVRVHAVLQRLTGMERRGPYAAHKACDFIIQEIRDVLKTKSATEASKTEILKSVRRHGRARVVLVKEIMGQGAMHDNVMLPSEPAGVPGGRQNVDLGNVPIVMDVNEVRDGGIHALCCIGPATKEVTRHYFREPILEALAADEEVDLVGVVFIGSPQVNDEKTFVAKRLGALVGTMNVDGAIVTTEGFGNNHIDFALNIEEIGKRGISVVGVSFCAYQGQLVVGNKYMDAMIEINKDKAGFESEKLAENSITPDDAKRAILMLKTKISGIAVAPSDRKWNQEVIDQNQKTANAIV
ncbi:MAG: D-proline reductase (dithiol) proprotein PrdA [Deltaproteobacteria bacterium]|nr:D-proline reductase (dithiol) proprotein PrdA [Deltaproteobacteria bacterium]